MLTPARKQQGFTLVELVVAIAVFAILLLLGMPAYTAWMQNSQIRVSAEGILNGLQTARAEAVRRNQPILFQLSGTGAGWSVALNSDGTVLQIRPDFEGNKTAVVTPTPSSASEVTFGTLGQVIANSDSGQPTMTQIDVTSSALASARNLRVLISPAGEVRMCDPALASSDPRAC
jgi:type IV fimbrial biogenesis protein FimT